MRKWYLRSRIPLLGLVFTLLLVLALGIGVSIVRAGTTGSTSPPATPDPRLVVRPMTTRLISHMSAGLVAIGSLSPTIPGKNAVQFDLRQHGHAPAGPLFVTLTFTMLDMKMAPQRTELIAHGRHYIGTIDLPMFGRYRVDVRIKTATSRYGGTLVLVLPLPRL